MSRTTITSNLGISRIQYFFLYITKREPSFKIAKLYHERIWLININMVGENLTCTAVERPSNVTKLFLRS